MGNQNKHPKWNVVYKFMQLVKSAVLDSAGFAGVFLVTLFWRSNEPLKYMTDNFTCVFIGSIVIAICTVILRNLCAPEVEGKWKIVDFFLQIGAVIFLWLIVVNGVLTSSKSDTAKESVKSTVDSQKMLLEAYKIENSRDIKTLEKRVFELNQKIENLEPKQ